MLRIWYALAAASVVTAAGGAISAGVLSLPEGPARAAAERFAAAPGRALMEHLDHKSLRGLRRETERRLEDGRERIEEAAEKLEEGAEAVGGKTAAKKVRKLAHIYSVSAWAVAGFVLCFLGTLVFGSDTYSSWQGIRDWMVSNIQSSTDSAQQFLAYEKCYKLTGRSDPNNCIAAHEPTSYTAEYPILSNSWNSSKGRMAEVTLAPGESSKKGK